MQKVVECDRRRFRAHPARRDHHRQVQDEVAHHLERGRARPDDDARANLGDRHRGCAQPVARFLARNEVLGVGVARHEAAEVDDAPQLGRTGGLGKVRGGFDVKAAEIPACGHRVDEVIGNVDALERGSERCRIERIGFDQLDVVPFARLEHLPVAGCRANPPAGRLQRRDEMGADVAAGTEHQRQRRNGRGLGSGHHRRGSGGEGGRCARRAV